MYPGSSAWPPSTSWSTNGTRHGSGPSCVGWSTWSRCRRDDGQRRPSSSPRTHRPPVLRRRVRGRGVGAEIAWKSAAHRLRRITMTSAPARSDVAETEERLRALFEAAEAEGFLHVRDVDGDEEFTFQGDARVVLASVFKIQIALEYARQAAAGKLDRAARHVIGDAFKEGDGIGTDSFAYDVELSVRDAAQLMMTM